MRESGGHIRSGSAIDGSEIEPAPRPGISRRSILAGSLSLAALGALAEIPRVAFAAGTLYNPFSSWNVTDGWVEHYARGSGGTDYDLNYGTPLPAPGSGTLRTSGGSGEWTAGWVGTAGRRAILMLDAPVPRQIPAQTGEAGGDIVAVVFQHLSEFGPEGHYSAGQSVGKSGASANLNDWGGDVHLHVHGLTASGGRVDFTKFITGSQPTAPKVAMGPVAIALSSGVIALYQTRDGKLHGTNQVAPGGGFAPWSQIGSGSPTIAGKPSVIQTPQGLIAAYALETDRIIGAGQSVAGGPFSAWAPMGTAGGGIVGAPEAIVTSAARIAIFAAVDNGNVAYTIQATTGGPFGTWTAIGSGAQPAAVGKPAAIQLPDGRLQVFTRSSTGTIKSTTQTAPNGSWGSWTDVGVNGGGVFGDPAVVLSQAGLVTVVSATSDNNVSYSTQAAPYGSFGSWASVGERRGDLVGSPDVFITSTGLVVVYSRTLGSVTVGTNQHVAGGSFAAWQAIGVGGGGALTDPASVLTPSGLIGVYTGIAWDRVAGAGQSTPGGSFGAWSQMG